MFFKFFVALLFVVSFSSCRLNSYNMREPNARVEFVKSDFALSNQLSAEAYSIRVLGIDWKRLFKKEVGFVDQSYATIDMANIPVIGVLLDDKTSNYALYELMKNNPGYDVVFYPQYEKSVYKPALGIGFFYKKISVKTTARLGKLN